MFFLFIDAINKVVNNEWEILLLYYIIGDRKYLLQYYDKYYIRYQFYYDRILQKMTLLNNSF